MSKGITIRSYMTGDAKKIYTLFESNTTFRRDAPYWVWINRLIGIDRAIIVVAEYKKKIIGHYGILPQYLIIGNNKFNGGLGYHAYVQDEYRKEVSIFELSNLAYKIAKEKGLLFVYGFPNENYRLIQEKIERWKKISLFRALEIKSSDLRDILKNDFEFQLATGNYIDLFTLGELLDDKVVIDTNQVCLFKNLNYYYFRYINHPQHLYTCFFLRKNSHQTASAFVVLKEYKSAEGVKGHLIDFVKTSLISEKELINEVLRFLKEKVDILSFWSINSSYKQILLDEFNFKEKGFDTFLGLKFLDKGFKNEYGCKVLDFDQWSLNMGDSDAF